MTDVADAPGRVTCLIRTDRDGLQRVSAAELDGLGSRIRKPGELLWIDIDTPSDADIALLESEIGVHPLAVEDLRRGNQRPKIDAYPDHHVIVTYDVRPPSAADETHVLGEIHLIVGDSFLVSVHWGASPALMETQSRFRANARALGSGVGALLYSILDAVGDGYFPVMDRFADDIDDVLERIVSQPSRQTLVDVIRMRRRLLEVRRVLAPQRDVANVLLRRDVDFIEPQADPYFQDLYDHLIRLVESVDVYRELLAATLDAQMSVTSNNLNAVMKRLTAFTVLLMVPTLIAGIYGMNFVGIPELTWVGGYPFALGMMLVAMLAIGIFFWRRGWL